MKKIKNIMTLGLFLTMPLLVLMAVQVSPAKTEMSLYDSPLKKYELERLIQKANTTSNYKMKRENF